MRFRLLQALRYISTVGLGTLLLLGCTADDDPRERERLPSDSVGPPVSALEAAPVLDTAATWRAGTMSRGQRLYVPIYSHIHFKNQERTIDLAATVSMRNTDPDRAIVLTRIDYLDNSGALVRRYLERPRRLGPMASTSVVVEEGDAAGGLGANFIVEWRAAQPVHVPVVESIMISTRSSLGISFASPARVLDERSE